MHKYLIEKINTDNNFKRYLYDNSNHIKYLNRNPSNYNNFMKTMKEQYKERTTDKINNIINTIDIVNSIIDTIN